jgi:hypothetical protein
MLAPLAAAGPLAGDEGRGEDIFGEGDGLAGEINGESLQDSLIDLTEVMGWVRRLVVGWSY